MTIVGRSDVPKEKVVVVGGVCFTEGISGHCHLQHLTIPQATHVGVFGDSSFTMEDAVVEQCILQGVQAYGRGAVGRFTTVQVRQFGTCGVGAWAGASIRLIGAKTTVRDNCTRFNWSPR